MDQLRTAFRLVAAKARQQRNEGTIPAFLGANGMVALMFKSIVDFKKTNDEPSFLLDLAVQAMFAFASTLPDTDFDDSEPAEDTEDGEDPPQQEEEPTADDARWSRIEPGKNLPSAKQQRSITESDEEHE